MILKMIIRDIGPKSNYKLCLFPMPFDFSHNILWTANPPELFSPPNPRKPEHPSRNHILLHLIREGNTIKDR